jgi:hypothetical protein
MTLTHTNLRLPCQILDLFVGVRVPEGQPEMPKSAEKSALFPLRALKGMLGVRDEGKTR